MASHYTIVQYVPDPITDERINVGVIAFTGHEIACRFVADWNRARRFGGEDVSFLRDFAEEVKQSESAQLVLGEGIAPHLNEEKLNAMAGRWVNSIQFTPPKGSLKSPQELADEMASRFLRGVERRRRQYRTRRTAVALAAEQVEQALWDNVGAATEHLFHRELTLRGRFEEHRFAVGVANGKPLLAVDALSFEVPDTKRLQVEIDAVAWAIDDVKKRERTLPIAVMVLPPRRKSETYERAVRTLGGLKAVALTDAELPGWAARQARKIASHAA